MFPIASISRSELPGDLHTSNHHKCFLPLESHPEYALLERLHSPLTLAGSPVYTLKRVLAQLQSYLVGLPELEASQALYFFVPSAPKGQNSGPLSANLPRDTAHCKSI